jgi:hypothetical protein
MVSLSIPPPAGICPAAAMISEVKEIDAFYKVVAQLLHLLTPRDHSRGHNNRT